MLLALVVMTAGQARAQYCKGMPSFVGQPFQARVSGEFNDQTTQFLGGVAYGANGFFGGVDVGVVNLDDLDASAVGVNLSGGYELRALDSDRRFRLCPVANVQHLFGPNDINGSGVDYSETTYGFGADLGVLASETESMQLIPTAGLGFNILNWSIEGGGGQIDDTETFFNLDLGVGMVFNGRMAVHPFVSIPMGLEGADASFGITLGMNFGGR
jgi:hypothetical protein